MSEEIENSSSPPITTDDKSKTIINNNPPTTSTTVASSNRKRRMSKKERKALKKQRKNRDGASSDSQDTAVVKECTTGGISSSTKKMVENSTAGRYQEESNGSDNDVVSSSVMADATKTTTATEQSSNDDNPTYSQSSLIPTSSSEEEKRFEKDCLKSYTPIPVPTVPSPDINNNKHKHQDDQNNGKKTKKNLGTDDGEGGNGQQKTTLGKWFPNALLIKCPVNYTNTGKLLLSSELRQKKKNHSNNDTNTTHHHTTPNPKSSLLLFYQYVDHTPRKAGKWSQLQLQLLMTYLSTVARQRHIGGRIRVAEEGVNVTVSAVDIPAGMMVGMGAVTAKETLRHFVRDLQNFDAEIFSSDVTDFKFVDDLPPDRHFKELKVMPVQELVFYGVKEEEEQQQQQGQGGRRKLQQEDGKSSVTTSGGGKRGEGGIHLDAFEYHKMLQKNNTVVIDVRNHYETVLGRFDGQLHKGGSKEGSGKMVGKDKESDTITTTTTPTSSTNKPSLPSQEVVSTTTTANDNDNNNSPVGAKYLDPLMRKSTDFPSWLSKPDTQKQLQNKTVLMYCTGGIRCERASSYLKEKMGDEVHGVYQLQGGIERYLKAFPNGGFWTGKNFVFDKREAVGVGNTDGDGGVIQKTKKKKSKSKRKNQDSGAGDDDDDDDDDLPSSRCCVCNKRWDRYVGKKKCFTCGVPVLMCDTCMSQKPDKTKGKELSVRCPLCVSENVTVPASEVELTANGIRGTVTTTTAAASAVSTTNTVTSQNKKDKGKDADNSVIDNKPPDANNDNSSKEKKNLKESDDVTTGTIPEKRKAADSVLKWGGGHATNKRKERKKKKMDIQQMKRILCQYGSECYRKDCFFRHPEREETSKNVCRTTAKHESALQ